MTIGQGLYQYATADSARTANAGLVLTHLCHQVAVDWRPSHPRGLAIWRGDGGNDGDQYTLWADGAQPRWAVDQRYRDPAYEARRFYGRFVYSALRAVPVGTFSIIHGPNEYWPSATDKATLRWRAEFELALCRIIQNEEGLRYAALACPTGNLEPEDVHLFAGLWREAWCINYHGYLRPGGATLDDPASCEYYFWRPLKMWAPELTRLGVKTWRLLFGECGTFYNLATTKITAEQQVALCIEIDKAMAAACQGANVEWLGAIPYGFGMVGQETAWELSGTERLIAAQQTQGGDMVTINDSRLETLVAAHPAAWAAWSAAGGVSDNFRRYLLGQAQIAVDGEALRFLGGQTKAAIDELNLALGKYPFPR